MNIKNHTPWILGIASSHNGAACLLHGGELVVAIQEERLLREKRAQHPGAFASLSISYCLDYAGITPDDLDAVVLCSATSNRTEYDDIYVNRQLHVMRSGTKVFYIPHHFGHAVAAYALSGADCAGVLVIDGNGSPWNEMLEAERQAIIPGQLEAASASGRTVPRENISLYSANAGNIVPIEKHVASYKDYPSSSSEYEFHTLGDMYGFLGKQIFGSFLEGPGKVMGLAPYGKPTIPVDEFYRITSLGFEFQNTAANRFRDCKQWPAHQQQYQDLAASVQAALEEAVLSLCSRMKGVSENLCYAGGVALNSVANERIVRETGFKNVFIMPAAEDSGSAIGAAYYGLWQLCGYSRREQQVRDNMGRCYADNEVCSAIEGLPGLISSRPPHVIEQTADLLSEGKIVGWFQGGSELGPRALGQRSILCDPRSPQVKDILNERVKFREAFRPFAPMVLEEDVYDWFDVERPLGFSPFMLRVLPFRPEQAPRVPGVVHVDGTGRVQTVSREAFPKLHCLLTAFKRKTGVPILLNTSFNIAGEPIVETPADALWCLSYTDMDACVLEDFLVLKQRVADIMMDYPLSIKAKSIFSYADGDNDGVQFQITHPSEAGVPVVSGHVARLQDLPWIADGMKWLRLFIIVDTPWGPAVHGLPSSFLDLLKLIDGHRTGRQIHELMACDNDTIDSNAREGKSRSLSAFRKNIALLKRIGAIGFESQPAISELAMEVSSVMSLS